MDTRELIRLLMRVEYPRLLVLGDFMLDHYTWGEVERISPEFPVPILLEKKEEFRLGGAGNVAQNICALGGKPICLGTLGDDPEGDVLVGLLKEMGCEALFERVGTTIVKHRYIAQGCPLFRVDREQAGSSSQDGVWRKAEEILEQVNGVVISDYGKGSLDYTCVRRLITKAKELHIPVLVDPKSRQFSVYQGVTLITPNREEVLIHCQASPKECAKRLRQELNLTACVVTLDREGFFLCTENEEIHFPSLASFVRDVTGAGDALLAAFAVGLASGIKLEEAALLGAALSGFVVEQEGTLAPKLGELLLWWYRTQPRREKLLTLEEAAFLSKKLQEAGKVVVFTNGCFDLLHPGHVDLLRYAKRQGDFLFVGVNSDESISKIKGGNRPFITLWERLELLSALEMVDALLVFSETTPYALIQALQPKVLVKGGEYRNKKVIGRDIVEKKGGKVAFAPHREGASTTALAERVAKKFQEENPSLRWKWEEGR